MRIQKIKTVKLVGKEQTYDIEVNNDSHLFFANGIATSNSHGVGYSELGYWCAYAKAHFPIHFFTSWLFYAKDKQFTQEEVEALIEDAAISGISVYPPTLKHANVVNISDFYSINNNIYFGISDVKKIGKSISNKVIETIKGAEKDLGKSIQSWTWYEFLTHVAGSISSTAINNLIAVGAVDYMTGSSRARKLFEYNVYSQLDSREQSYIKYVEAKSLDKAIESILSDDRLKRTIARKTKLKGLLDSIRNAPYSTEDTKHTIITAEENLLGVPLSCSRIDTCAAYGESSCDDLQFKKNKAKASIAVEILNVREHTIKNGNSKGKKMAFLKVKDRTATYDKVVIFADVYEMYASLLTKANTCLLSGIISEKNNEKSFIVNEVTQI